MNQAEDVPIRLTTVEVYVSPAANKMEAVSGQVREGERGYKVTCRLTFMHLLWCVYSLSLLTVGLSWNQNPPPMSSGE